MQGLTLGHEGFDTGLFPMDFLFERRDRHYAHRYPHAYIIPGMIRNTPGHLNTGVILWEEAPR